MGKKKKAGGARVLLTVVCVVLSLILLALIAAAFALAYLDKIWSLTVHPDEVSQNTLSSSQIQELEENTEPEDEVGTEPTMLEENVTWATEPAETIGGKEASHIINILLVGMDAQTVARGHSDAMILCTVNTEKKTLIMTSFQRDTYVQIPGYKDNKINNSFLVGGAELLNECLLLNFGVHVDGNVSVNFADFIKLIDKMGGVRINLTSAEVGYLHKCGYEAYPGMNRLDGERALCYARIRKLDSDFGRTNRQRTLIISLLNKVKEMSYKEQYSLLLELLPLITTDIETPDILQYAMTILPILKDLTVTTQYIPAEGTYTRTRIRGKSVLLPDLEKNRQILIDTLMGE